MTDTGYRRLIAAILHRAARDYKQNIQPRAAWSFLTGEDARTMFEALEIDQDRFCAKLKKGVKPHDRARAKSNIDKGSALVADAP
jgi:hypothetical protein